MTTVCVILGLICVLQFVVIVHLKRDRDYCQDQWFRTLQICVGLKKAHDVSKLLVLELLKLVPKRD